jgi:hypothetical protein
LKRIIAKDFDRVAAISAADAHVGEG